MKKIVVIFLFIFILAGCSSVKDETFIDDLGNKVFVSNPERVSALTGSFAEVCSLAGLSLVSVTSDAYSERNMVLDDSVVNVGSLKKPSLELILSSNPDFVVLSSQIAGHTDIGNSLKSMGIPVAYFETESFEGYLHMLDILTDLSGKKENYQQYGLNIKKNVEDSIEEAKKHESPKVLLIRAYATNALAKDSHNFVGAMLSDLGCINIADNKNSFLEKLSMEVIIQEDPDFIFVTTMGDDKEALEALANGIMNHPAWKDLKAIQNNHYYVLEKELYHYKPNARWGESYAKLERILYE